MPINEYEFKNLLQNNNLKLTKPRVIVFRVFNNHNNDHLSLEEVYKYSNEMDRHVGLATIYRTVKLFEDMDLIKKIDLGEKSSRYEVKFKDKEHFHLKCKKCGRIIEVKHTISKEFRERIYKEMGFEITDFNLKFNGLCDECQEK